MEDVKFNLEEIEKTFTIYDCKKIYEGYVVLKQELGVVFSIGGKNDIFINKEEFDNYEEVKIGDRYSIMLTNEKTEDGMMLASKRKADIQIMGNLNAKSLKIGSVFSFVGNGVEDNCLVSKLGTYKIIIPRSEVEEKIVYLDALKNKHCRAIVTDIDHEKSLIMASMKLLNSQEKEKIDSTFWNKVFINKVVKGTVVKILPYGAFVEVDGYSCFVHISDLSYTRISSVNDVLEEGKEYDFRILKLDKDTGKVSLGVKQLYDDPKIEKIKNVKAGEQYDGEVTKILPFGAIVSFNDLTGLIHISEVTDDMNRKIYEFVKLCDKVKVEIKSVDYDSLKISLTLVK